jgi:hypothetical protein
MTALNIVPKFNLESLKNLSIFIVVLALLSVIGLGSFYGYREFQENRRERKLILEGIAKVNRKVVLQQILSEKMPDIPVETVVALSDKIYERAQVYGIDLSLVCGLIDTESKWDVRATSNVGAKGLMQLMPVTARPYLANHQLGYSDTILYDPVINVTVGMAYFFDLHQQYIELGVEKENEYMFSVNSYFWGQNNVAILLGKKDARVTGPNFAYAKRVTDAAKLYKEKGL